jgi:hypothetical protein
LRKVKVMTLNTHATPEATVNFPADHLFGLPSEESESRLPELSLWDLGPGEVLFAQEPGQSVARMAASLDDEDEEDEVDDEDDDLDEDDDEDLEDEEDFDDEDDDDEALDEDDEDEYLDDEDEEDDEEE